MDPNEKKFTPKDKSKSKVKVIPSFILPNSDAIQLNDRLKIWISSCHLFKCNERTINQKTKKFLSRNGFHSLFWSAIVVDERIKALIDDIFGDNIKYISDNDFEKVFGIEINKNSTISADQLIANYFLLFSLPAKSYTEYLQEWAKRRLDAWTATINRQKLTFDVRQELFVETKRRFYVYKQLVPALTRFVLNSFETYSNDVSSRPMKELFRQIKIAINYSGLQVFYMSWNFTHCNRKALDLESVKEDINRITEARNTIIQKYGEELLPFARLLNFPEVSQLNRSNYPDLAVCAKCVFSKERTSLEHLRFRNIKTKTPIDQLERLAATHRPHIFKVFTDEEKEILISMGLFPGNEIFDTLTTFANPFL